MDCPLNPPGVPLLAMWERGGHCPVCLWQLAPGVGGGSGKWYEGRRYLRGTWFLMLGTRCRFCCVRLPAYTSLFLSVVMHGGCRIVLVSARISLGVFWYLPFSLDCFSAWYSKLRVPQGVYILIRKPYAPLSPSQHRYCSSSPSCAHLPLCHH